MRLFSPTILVLAIVLGFCPFASADIITETGPQNGARRIEGVYRATYLGKLFGSFANTSTLPFQTMTAAVTINGASNTQLWVGSGGSSSSFASGIPSGLLDTGIRFTQAGSNSDYEIAAVQNWSLSPSLGANIRTALNTNGGLDVWLVGPSTSTYDAPAGSIGSNQSITNGYGLSLTAVPEPTSLGLVLGAVGVGGLYRRWRRKSIGVRS